MQKPHVQLILHTCTCNKYILQHMLQLQLSCSSLGFEKVVVNGIEVHVESNGGS